MDDKPINILLIEDNPGDTRLIQEMLMEDKDFSFSLHRFDQLSHGLDHITKGGIDIVLLDLSLPDSQGMTTFEKLYSHASGVPIIILTVFDDEMIAVKAVQKGAQDFLIKGQVNSYLLIRSIRYAINRKQAEETLRASHRFLEITNRHIEMSPLLQEFVAEVKMFTGCVAVGIRILDEEGNIPYQAYEGFTQEFFQLENPLSINQGPGMCLMVTKGTTDPALPFFTEGGSFYVNGTTRFLATASEEYLKRTRNVCNQFGYESVALIPIRS
ncbi:MAG: response regulator, partial [Thermoplasmata archaeon]